MTVKNLKADSITAGSITLSGENLIHNTDFVKKGTGWSGDGIIDTVELYNGYNSLKFTNIGSEYSEMIPASYGESFVITVKTLVKTGSEPSTNALVILEEFATIGGDRIAYQESAVSGVKDTWQKYIASYRVKDPTTKFVRIRLYNRSSTGQTNFAQPMLSRGTIASEWKLHNDELISNGAIDNDKLGDGSVSSDKLNIDELFVGNNAFIQSLKAFEIDAGQITTGKIRNEVIDISGLVTFESFAPEIKPLFNIQGDKTYINGGTIAANTIQANSIDLLSGISVKGPDNQNSFAISSNGEVEVNAWLHSSNYVKGVSGYSINRDGTAELNEVRVRGTFDAIDAGITNSIDDDDAIRIWAGGTYENRHAAKFRVNKRGDLFATDATLSGVLYGDLVNDNLTIDNGAVVINDGVETVVSINSGQILLNTDVVIGNNNVRYSKGEATLNLSNTNFQVNSSYGTVLINKNGGTFGGLNIIGPSGGHHILRGSTAKNKLGTLVFDSEGNQGEMGDFSFTRKNYAERCKVNIYGDLTVAEKIGSTREKIEMRWVDSGTYKGIGFYVM